MKKNVVLPAVVAIGGIGLAIGGAILTNRILAKSKNREAIPETPPSREAKMGLNANHSDLKLTPEQEVLMDPQRLFGRVPYKPNRLD